jgi:hypothetical protein
MGEKANPPPAYPTTGMYCPKLLVWPLKKPFQKGFNSTRKEKPADCQIRIQVCGYS